jgi:hypothetical protein
MRLGVLRCDLTRSRERIAAVDDACWPGSYVAGHEYVPIDIDKLDVTRQVEAT